MTCCLSFVNLKKKISVKCVRTFYECKSRGQIEPKQTYFPHHWLRANHTSCRSGVMVIATVAAGDSSLSFQSQCYQFSDLLNLTTCMQVPLGLWLLLCTAILPLRQVPHIWRAADSHCGFGRLQSRCPHQELFPRSFSGQQTDSRHIDKHFFIFLIGTVAKDAPFAVNPANL